MIRLRPLLLILPLLLCLSGDARGQATPPDSPRAAAIKAHLRDILAAPEYQPEPPGSPALERIGSWINARLRAFRDWLGRLLPSGLEGSAGATSVVFWLVLAALVVGLAYVIAYATRRMSGRAPTAKRRKPAVTTAQEPEETAAAGPEAWLETARRYAETGDFRRAYRAVFVAILLRMDRMGALQFDRARTNGEYLRVLRARPPLYTLLRPLARDFDARWYGRHPVAEEDYQRLEQAYQQLSAEG